MERQVRFSSRVLFAVSMLLWSKYGCVLSNEGQCFFVCLFVFCLFLSFFLPLFFFCLFVFFFLNTLGLTLALDKIFLGGWWLSL